MYQRRRRRVLKFPFFRSLIIRARRRGRRLSGGGCPTSGCGDRDPRVITLRFNAVMPRSYTSRHPVCYSYPRRRAQLPTMQDIIFRVFQDRTTA